MSKLKLLGCSTILALAVLVGPAPAQYIYLDANGDGVNTPADTLNPTGPTVLTIYLNTNHDKDGSLQTCNSHTTALCGATPSSTALDLLTYQIYLSTVGGTVTWGAFTPDSSSFSTLQTQRQDTHDVEFTFARQPPGSASPAGLNSLGKIPVTITSGSPAITFPRYPNTPLDPNSFGTTFGTHCTAFAFGNSYVLGDRADSCGAVGGVAGDWFDVDGIGPLQAGAPSPPTVSTGNDGDLYLGGNHIDAPYELSYMSGRLVVNGLALRTVALPRRTFTYTDEERAQIMLVQRIGDVCDSLSAVDVTGEAAGKVLGSMCASNPVVASFDQDPHAITVHFRNGRQVQVSLGSRGSPGRSVDPVKMEMGELQQIRKFLDRGCIVFVLSTGTSVIVPAGKRTEVSKLVSRLQSGGPFEKGEEQILPDALQMELRTPIELTRVK
jgi:hypothetical protein